MRRLVALASPITLAACGIAEQPDWIETVAAYGIETSSKSERDDLLAVLNQVAEEHGHHLDSASEETLEEVYELTINACVWKGQEDDETLACAMDSEDRPGLVYLTFNKGTDPVGNDAFRSAATAALEGRFGRMRSIPVMPNGALPLARDLAFDGEKYSVSEEDFRKYKEDVGVVKLIQPGMLP